tara:strand:- start:95 stop:319 length:225 start_codon:yes stop_codon:yes gene_type:complete
MKFLNVPVLIISLSIGLFFSYVIKPNTNIIYVYPTPENIDKIQYKDKGDNCFGFTSKEVKCPSNQAKIRQYPVQ